jgi:uncharacterized protein YndB with AHSA1/START domain
MSNDNPSKASKKRDLVITRVFDAPLEIVWQAWVEPEKIKQWWGPEGFTCSVAKIDFREGETSFVCMRAPKDRRFHLDAENVMVCFKETLWENWSFGGGRFFYT